jgi:hypothetical protein
MNSQQNDGSEFSGGLQTPRQGIDSNQVWPTLYYALSP